MRVFIWKEIREIRWVWLSTLVGLIVLFFICGKEREINYTQGGALLITLYSWYIGARSFAIEKGEHTEEYLYTRPIHPSRVLLSKYFVGVLQLMVLLLCGILPLMIIHKDKYYLDFFISPGFPFLIGIFILNFSLFFIISLLFGDTLRSLLIGFVTSVCLVWLINLKRDILFNNFLFINDSLLYFYIFTLYLACIFLIILGVLGLLYYRKYYKHFIFKTSYSAFIPISILLVYSTYPIFYGTIAPMTYQRETLPGYKGSYYDKKIYSFKSLPKVNTNQLCQLDVKDPFHPVEKTLFTLPLETYQYGIQGNLVYFYDKTKKYRQLVIYELLSNDTPRELHRITFSEDTSPYAYIFQMGDSVILHYSVFTGYSYLDKHNQPVPPEKASKSNSHAIGIKHFVKINLQKGQIVEDYIDSDTTNNLIRKLYSPVYGDYQYRMTDNGLEVYPLAEWHSTTAKYILHIPNLKNVNLFTVQDHYLYRISEENALEAYDISDMQRPTLIGSTPWDWIESLDNKKQVLSKPMNYFWESQITINGKRALVFYNRGFMVFDISNPGKPMLLGKMNSDNIQHCVYDKDYMYVTGQQRGYSVYRIP